ncbi:hypothetical protein [Desulfonatronum lacustre]|uniref:hypothetical protein n=1 Tax=Desulfonatronum lacustre TaxID=66849 RepID=UPI0012EC94A1|nr:hypothetical protein [Desulfonatronum lacustre]
MPEYLSHQHAKNSIRLIYQNRGFQLSDAVPGNHVQNELGVDIRNAPYAALYAFVDEYIVLLRCQSVYFLSADHKIFPSAMTFYRLSIRLLRTLTSIRVLCGYGLDANARLQLRLLYETAQLWVRFRIDHDILGDYTACTTPETANEFWHKYLSKEKTERYLKKQLQEGGFSWIGGMEDQIKDLKQKLSLVAHPTFIADYHETLSDWNGDPETSVIIEPLKSSYFTLSKAIFITTMPFSIFPDPPYNLGSMSLRQQDAGWNPIPHPTESWEDYNHQLRNMFPSLFLMVIRFFEEFDKAKNN